MDGSPRNPLQTMETQTTFDLNLAIQRWREDLSRSAAFRNENLNELESHLRDSIDRLQTPQLSDAEAFLIASQRIGSARQLEAEFGKLNGRSLWADRLLWVLIGIQGWMALSVFCSVITLCANRVATGASMRQGYYSDAQRRWVVTHGPGALAIIFEILGLLVPPIVLGLVIIIAWKMFLRSKLKILALMDKNLNKPMRLGFLLFAVSFGFLFVFGSFQEFEEHHMYWWQIALIQMCYTAPQCLVGAALTTVLARERMRIGASIGIK